MDDTLAAFAILGLVLASVGLYGVISYLVAQRTNEIGIRMALGANTAKVLGLVMNHGVVLTLVGLGVGLGLAFVLNRVLASTMPMWIATDPLALGATALALFAVSMIACWAPAWRATKINPLEAIHAE